MKKLPNIVSKTKDRLVIASDVHPTRVYEFRKLKGRPIEMQQRCKVNGIYSAWQVARNFCLKAIISYDALVEHFHDAEDIA